MLSEAYRHAKAIGAWGAGSGALEAAGISGDTPGITVGDGPDAVVSAVQEMLASHRAWDRFPAAPVGG
jgi:catalase